MKTYLENINNRAKPLLQPPFRRYDPAPNMMIEVYAGRNVAEALTYQDTYIFTAVYAEDGGLVDDTERRSLNNFLHTWLGNLIEQGHSIKGAHKLIDPPAT